MVPLSEDAKHLVEENLAVVRAVVVRHFARCGVELADIYQLGYLGLMTAAQSWIKRDGRVNCSFTTFAYPRILTYIRKKAFNNSKRFYLGGTIIKFRQLCYAESGEWLDIYTLAEVFNIKLEDIKEALCLHEGNISLDSESCKTDENGNNIKWVESCYEDEIIDDRLSPLDLLILKEQHILRRRKEIAKKQKKVKSLRDTIRSFDILPLDCSE